MNRDDLEFSITQYADGTLPADQREALEAVLAADAGARALLEEYRKLDAALAGDRAARPLPAVNWDRLAERILADVFRREADGVTVPDEVEFAIARFADGSLEGAERETVEAELASNPACRLLLAEYIALDAALKEESASLPAVKWGRLAEEISSAVAKHDDASAAGDLPEELEFRIAQFADGTLPAGERETVEAVLAEQPATRLLLAEYVALGGAVEAVKGQPLPAVRWDRLADEISTAVAREAESQQVEQAATVGRSQQPDSYSIFAWLRSPMRLAAAASVVLAVGVGATILWTTGGTKPAPDPGLTGPVVAEVAGPTVELAKGEAVESITIGPPPGRSEFATGFTDDMITRPSRSFVAGGTPPPPREDVAHLPWPQ